MSDDEVAALQEALDRVLWENFKEHPPTSVELAMLAAAGISAEDIHTAVDRWVHSRTWKGGSVWGYVRATAWSEAVKRAEMRAALLAETRVGGPTA